MRTAIDLHGWDATIAGEATRASAGGDHQPPLEVVFECETLKADEEAEAHLGQFLPALIGRDAIVNLGPMTISFAGAGENLSDRHLFPPSSPAQNSSGELTENGCGGIATNHSLTHSPSVVHEATGEMVKGVKGFIRNGQPARDASRASDEVTAVKMGRDAEAAPEDVTSANEVGKGGSHENSTPGMEPWIAEAADCRATPGSGVADCADASHPEVTPGSPLPPASSFGQTSKSTRESDVVGAVIPGSDKGASGRAKKRPRTESFHGDASGSGWMEETTDEGQVAAGDSPVQDTRTPDVSNSHGDGCPSGGEQSLAQKLGLEFLGAGSAVEDALKVLVQEELANEGLLGPGSMLFAGLGADAEGGTEN